MKQTSLRIFLALMVLVAVVLGTSALATTTWTSKAGGDFPSSTSVTTTGTEAAPSTATDGFSLVGVSGFTVIVEALPNGDGGALSFTAGSLLGYVYNPISGKWARSADLDCTGAAGSTYSCPGYAVTSPRGRVAFVPSGLGTAVNVYVNGTRGR